MNGTHVDFDTLITFTNQFEKSPKGNVSKIYIQLSCKGGDLIFWNEVKKYGQTSYEQTKIISELTMVNTWIQGYKIEKLYPATTIGVHWTGGTVLPVQ